MFGLLRLYLKNKKGFPFIQRNKKGALELDELGKIIIGAVLLLVLIGIVIYLSGEFDSQKDSTKDALNILK